MTWAPQISRASCLWFPIFDPRNLEGPHPAVKDGPFQSSNAWFPMTSLRRWTCLPWKITVKNPACNTVTWCSSNKNQRGRELIQYFLAMLCCMAFFWHFLKLIWIVPLDAMFFSVKPNATAKKVSQDCRKRATTTKNIKQQKHGNFKSISYILEVKDLWISIVFHHFFPFGHVFAGHFDLGLSSKKRDFASTTKTSCLPIFVKKPAGSWTSPAARKMQVGKNYITPIKTS